MTRNEIFQTIQVAIKSTFPEADPSTFKMTTHLQNDLGADSMDNISLMMELEDQFNASLPMEQACRIENIAQIVDLIDEHLKLTPRSTLTLP